MGQQDKAERRFVVVVDGEEQSRYTTKGSANRAAKKIDGAEVLTVTEFQVRQDIELEERMAAELSGKEDGFGNEVSAYLPPEDPEAREAAKKDAEASKAESEKAKAKASAAECLERMNRNLSDKKEGETKKKRSAGGNPDKRRQTRPKKEGKPKAIKTTWGVYVLDAEETEKEIEVATGLGYKDGDPVVRKAIADYADRIILVVNEKNGNEYRKLGADVRKIRREAKAAAKAAEKAAAQRKKEGEAERNKNTAAA